MSAMRTLVPTPKAPHQVKHAQTTLTTPTHLTNNHAVNSILHLQRTIGNQAVQRLLAMHTNATAAERSEQQADRSAAHSDNTLSSQERSFFEPRFGHDFSQVRIHADANSARMADSMDAEAFTYGRDIYFGSGKRGPQTTAANPLLAHELAHVVQQSHTGPRLQPKLRITGNASHVSRAIALLNSGLGRFYHVSIDRTGLVSIESVRAAHQSSATGPTAQQRALADQLSTVINDSHNVNMTASAGSATLIGNFPTADFDIADVEMIGVSALIHEIVEQYQRQARGMAVGDETTGAHGAGIVAEQTVRGATRGTEREISQTINADRTVTGVYEIPYTYPNGRRRIMVLHIRNSNIQSVTWRDER